MNLGRNSIEIIANEIHENEGRIRLTDVREGEKLNNWKKITLKNMGYSYPDSTVALKNINLEIRHDEFIGITGPSGGGKSTLLMIILGLLVPTEGEILVDDIPITDATRLRKWQNTIGYVPQGLFLINAPMMNNIAYCEDDADINEKRVEETIDLVHLRDYVNSRPGGIHDSIGEQGELLSGGERQRVVIARALYRDPDLLAFDEATSSLDAKTESSISDSLYEFKGQKTMIAIAHRLTTFKHCDRIIMMGIGEVIGFDSFEKLKENCPPFANLVKLSTLPGKK